MTTPIATAALNPAAAEPIVDEVAMVASALLNSVRGVPAIVAVQAALMMAVGLIEVAFDDATKQNLYVSLPQLVSTYTALAEAAAAAKHTA